MDMQQGHATWACSMDMQPAVLTCGQDMQHRQAAGQAAWTCSRASSMDMQQGKQHGHAAGTCNMGTQQGNAARKCSLGMLHVHAARLLHVHDACPHCMSMLFRNTENIFC
jgi:hypothetical protein